MDIEIYNTEKRDSIEKVLTDYRPLIASTVNKYRGTGLPPEILETEAKLIVAKALSKFDNEKGSLPGYLKLSMKEMERAVNNMSLVYVPQATARKLTEYRKNMDGFQEKNDRIPTFEEMADLMKIPPKYSERIMQSATRRAGITGEEFEVGVAPTSPSVDVATRAETVYGKLTDPTDKLVIEYVFGLHGRPTISTNQGIANIIGMSESTVRNIKDKIIDVYRSEYNG